MPISTTSRRRYRVTLRFSLAEKQALAAAALRSGLQVSAFIRLQILNAKPLRAARRPTVEKVLLARLLAKLGTIASCLADLAAAMRGRPHNGDYLPSTERELSRRLSELGQCRAALMRALGRRVSTT
jgi:hypothetical protein